MLLLKLLPLQKPKLLKAWETTGVAPPATAESTNTYQNDLEAGPDVTASKASNEIPITPRTLKAQGYSEVASVEDAELVKSDVDDPTPDDNNTRSLENITASESRCNGEHTTNDGKCYSVMLVSSNLLMRALETKEQTDLKPKTPPSVAATCFEQGHSRLSSAFTCNSFIGQYTPRTPPSTYGTEFHGSGSLRRRTSAPALLSFLKSKSDSSLKKPYFLELKPTKPPVHAQDDAASETSYGSDTVEGWKAAYYSHEQMHENEMADLRDDHEAEIKNLSEEKDEVIDDLKAQLAEKQARQMKIIRDRNDAQSQLKKQKEVLNQAVSTAQNKQQEFDLLKAEYDALSHSYTNFANGQENTISSLNEVIDSLRSQLACQPNAFAGHRLLPPPGFDFNGGIGVHADNEATREIEQLRQQVAEIAQDRKRLRVANKECKHQWEQVHMKWARLSKATEHDEATTAELNGTLKNKDRALAQMAKDNGELSTEVKTLKDYMKHNDKQSAARITDLDNQVKSLKAAYLFKKAMKAQYQRYSENLLSTLRTRLYNDDVIKELSDIHQISQEENNFLAHTADAQMGRIERMQRGVALLADDLHGKTATNDRHVAKIKGLQDAKARVTMDFNRADMRLDTIIHEHRMNLACKDAIIADREAKLQATNQKLEGIAKTILKDKEFVLFNSAIADVRRAEDCIDGLTRTIHGLQDQLAIKNYAKEFDDDLEDDVEYRLAEYKNRTYLSECKVLDHQQTIHSLENQVLRFAEEQAPPNVQHMLAEANQKINELHQDNTTLRNQYASELKKVVMSSGWQHCVNRMRTLGKDLWRWLNLVEALLRQHGLLERIQEADQKFREKLADRSIALLGAGDESDEEQVETGEGENEEADEEEQAGEEDGSTDSEGVSETALDAATHTRGPELEHQADDWLQQLEEVAAQIPSPRKTAETGSINEEVTISAYYAGYDNDLYDED